MRARVGQRSEQGRRGRRARAAAALPVERCMAGAASFLALRVTPPAGDGASSSSRASAMKAAASALLLLPSFTELSPPYLPATSSRPPLDLDRLGVQGIALSSHMQRENGAAGTGGDLMREQDISDGLANLVFADAG